MKEKIHICVLANMGIGGTEKAATIFAANLVQRGYSEEYWGDSGPRETYLRAHGVSTLRDERTPVALVAYVERVRPHIVHQHVPGYPTNNPLYRALPRLPENVRPKVIETNVFGRL